MSSFNRNLIRIVVVVIVVFIAIPYMLPEMREDRYNPNPFAAAETAPKKGYFAKMIDKVLTFYGFKKKPKTAGLPAFNPNLPDNSTAPAAADTAPAPQSTAQAAAQRAHAERVAQLTGQNSAQGRAPNSEILETGGKKYEVITDIAGKKFVLTAQGPRPATEQEL
ncbi:MAG: hypothetical protein LBR90_03785, partial [Elusimicrobiota bacterium]|nr:hypothetical protein [Elusimicrobiota bacterium]